MKLNGLGMRQAKMSKMAGLAPETCVAPREIGTMRHVCHQSVMCMAAATVVSRTSVVDGA